MAEETPAEPIEPEPEPAVPPGWSQIWQVPALLLGLGIFVLGIYFAWPQPQEDQFDPVLDEVLLYLKARNVEEAQAVLKTRLEPFMARADRSQQARYYLLWGDLVFLQQEVNGWDKPENHHKTLRYYQRARELGMPLDETHLERMAHTLVALKRDKEAVEILDQLKEAPAQRRYGVVRKIIERRRDAGAKIPDLMTLITRFENELRGETDQARRREQQMWAVHMQAHGLLQIDQTERAIEYLQRRMIQFMAAGGDDDLASLRVLLAKAFERLGEYDESQRWYRLAQQKLKSTDLLNADVLVGLAQIDLAQTGDARSALENFSIAESEYPTAPAYLDALVGRADCEARLGAHAEALEHFGLAVKIVTDATRRPDDKVDHLVGTIRAHFDFNVGRADYDLALDYLSLVHPVYPEEMPPEIMLEFAVIHELIAEDRLARFSQDDDLMVSDQLNESKTTLSSDAKIRRLAMQEAAVHFGKAGEYYFRHAHTVTGTDDDAFGRSLWSSALSFDKAQFWDKAIKVYAEFVKARPDDPRQTEAINRLGLAYQSAGQYEVAADLFKQLIEEHENTPEAYKSLVPLARCHVATEAYDDAERVLTYVVTDHPAIRPDSDQYRQALIGLGKLYYKIRRFEPAIARLDEAVERYGQTRQGPQLRYRLADAYRLSVLEIDKTLEKTLPQADVVEFRAERARRLELAQKIFGQVISEIESIDASKRSALEKLFLRNAFFYRADCAFDLGRYDQAISLYDLAAKRWEAHPASLVALVQIVNAYSEMGRIQEAKVANDRARWQLDRMSDEAFDDPNLPMTRQHWQQWLRWTSELELFGPRVSSAEGSSSRP